MLCNAWWVVMLSGYIVLPSKSCCLKSHPLNHFNYNLSALLLKMTLKQRLLEYIYGLLRKEEQCSHLTSVPRSVYFGFGLCVLVSATVLSLLPPKVLVKENSKTPVKVNKGALHMRFGCFLSLN